MGSQAVEDVVWQQWGGGGEAAGGKGGPTFMCARWNQEGYLGI